MMENEGARSSYELAYLSDKNIATAIEYCNFKGIDRVAFKFNYDPAVRGAKDLVEEPLILVVTKRTVTFTVSELENEQDSRGSRVNAPDDLVEMLVEFTKEEMDKLK